jgi:hypothetical protein
VFDNLEKTRQYRADFHLELIQEYYTETRLVQVTELDIDGREQTQEMNVNEIEEEFNPETGETVSSEILNDLTIGEYSVIVSSIPHQETMQDTIFSQALQMREAGVIIPDWVLIENSRLPNRDEVAEVVKKMQGMAEPTPEEIEMQLMQQKLELQGQQAQVRGLMAKAMLDEALSQKALVEAGVAEQQPMIDMQVRGAEMRVAMEKQDKELQTKIAELETRLEIARSNQDTNRFVAQVESIGSRTASALKHDSDLKKIAAGASKPAAKKGSST